MFSKKYVFETRRTKGWRFLKNLCLSFCGVIVLFIITGAIILMIAKKEDNRSSEVFYKSSPGLISVFTGHAGRIKYAIKIAKMHHTTPLFITGVYAKNSLETLGRALKFNTLDYNKNLIEIDYLARNTVENVIATIRRLRRNTSISRVIVISHDYHIMRIKLIMNSIRSKKDNFSVYYSSVPTKYDNWRNIKILYSEVYKSLKALVFLMMWDSDGIQ